MEIHDVETHLVRLAPAREPSLGEALDHARRVGQRMLADELRLFLFEAEVRLGASSRRAAWVGLGSFCLVLGWIGFLLAAVFALELWMPLELGLAVAGGSQLVLGLLLLGLGMRRRRT